jgi:GNAT superfamily N-acetyltransferase
MTAHGVSRLDRCGHCYKERHTARLHRPGLSREDDRKRTHDRSTIAEDRGVAPYCSVVRTGESFQIVRVEPDSRAAQYAMATYIADVASRYYGRPATKAEIEEALAQHPSHDLRPPTGFFLVAVPHGDSATVRGSVALAVVEPGMGEVRRLHVQSAVRGQGVGRRLVLDLEQRARQLGLLRLRLDTRRDLVESQLLYQALGYEPSPAHSGGPYSDLWFSKAL